MKTRGLFYPWGSVLRSFCFSGVENRRSLDFALLAHQRCAHLFELHSGESDDESSVESGYLDQQKASDRLNDQRNTIIYEKKQKRIEQLAPARIMSLALNQNPFANDSISDDLVKSQEEFKESSRSAVTNFEDSSGRKLSEKQAAYFKNSNELVDVAHSISGRQKKGSQVSTKLQGVYPIKATTINVSQLIEVVNSTYKGILSKDVLNNLGEEKTV